MEEWADDTDDGATGIDPMKQKYLCTSCYLHKAKPYEHPIQDFGVLKREEFFAKYVSQGSWTRCLQCQKKYGALSHTVQAVAQDSAAVCQLCTELCNRALELGQHCCRICKQIHPASHWTSDVMKKHRGAAKRYLVCEDCTTKGYSSLDVTT